MCQSLSLEITHVQACVSVVVIIVHFTHPWVCFFVFYSPVFINSIKARLYSRIHSTHERASGTRKGRWEQALWQRHHLGIRAQPGTLRTASTWYSIKTGSSSLIWNTAKFTSANICSRIPSDV